jgi:hypothetical protein
VKTRTGITVLVFVMALALSAGAALAQVRTGRAAPEVAGGPWLNSPPLTMDGLRGRVVLVEFWTHG